MILFSSRRHIAAVIAGVVLGVSVLALATRAPAVPAAQRASAPAPAHPLCALRAHLPAPFFRLLVQIFRTSCPPSPPTTTSSTARVTTTTMTTTVHYDYFGLYGTLRLAQCAGTPESPGTCGAAVPAAGQVRAGDRLVATDAEGRYHAFVIGTVSVEGVIPSTPERTVVCPVATAVGSGGGQIRSIHDPVCHAFAVSSTTTTRPTTTYPPLGDLFGFEGYLGFQACEGTPAAPVGCDPVARVAGQVELGARLVATDAGGFYRAGGFGGETAIRGVLRAPAGHILDCPVERRYPSPGGLAGTRVDPVCRSFPAAHDH